MVGQASCLVWMLLAAVCFERFAWAQQRHETADLEEIGKRDINRKGSPAGAPSLERELLIGTQVAREFEWAARVNSDFRVLRLIERVGGAVARNSDARFPILPNVVESEERNVIALPGGRLYVTTGLIGAASTEAELAAAMAQGIAHIAARHVVERQGRTRFLNLLSAPPAVAAAIYLLRDQTMEADFLGVQYLYKAGYDPNAAVRMLQTLEVQDAPAKSRLVPSEADSYMPEVVATTPSSLSFRTHPSVAERIQAIERAATSLPFRGEHLVTSSEFESIRRQLSR